MATGVYEAKAMIGHWTDPIDSTPYDPNKSFFENNKGLFIGIGLIVAVFSIIILSFYFTAQQEKADPSQVYKMEIVDKVVIRDGNGYNAASYTACVVDWMGTGERKIINRFTTLDDHVCVEEIGDYLHIRQSRGWMPDFIDGGYKYWDLIEQ